MRRAIAFILIIAGLLPAGCAAQGDEPKATPVSTPQAAVSTFAQAETPVSAPTPVPSTTPEGMATLAQGFSSQPIPDEVFDRMRGNSYPEGCGVPLESLRYVRVLHMGFDGQPREGELVVNAAIAGDILEIFKALYDAGYPIEKMRLIDDYGAVDEDSMADNNTSAFCYRTISGSDKLSYHARGLAVDINPLYNPYVSAAKLEPAAGAPFADRSQYNPYFIDGEDLCCRLFQEHGFSWGGDWNSVKDYQHFEMREFG